jgi:MIT (microtubule interacting and transport) domain
MKEKIYKSFQDSAKNYAEAARCYREAIVGFKTVAQSKNISPQVKTAILSKCELYEERLKKLDRYLLSKAGVQCHKTFHLRH